MSRFKFILQKNLINKEISVSFVIIASLALPYPNGNKFKYKKND